jgi:chemotaxis protein CheD
LQEEPLVEYPVRIGEVRVAGGHSLLFTIGLGSCVAIALYDDVARVGGLAHVMLPSPRQARHKEQQGRFATTAVPQLVDMMKAEGAVVSRMRARLAGGASMFRDLLDNEGLRLGRRNVEAAHAALEAYGLSVDAEDVFGTYGRSVFLRTTDGQLTVTSVDNDDRVF